LKALSFTKPEREEEDLKKQPLAQPKREKED